MSEYIEREAAYSLAKKICKAVDSNPRVLLPRIILDLIDDLPAADAVPVVRCDDCINFTYGENESEHWEWCILLGRDVSHDNYCSYGTKIDKDGSE